MKGIREPDVGIFIDAVHEVLVDPVEPRRPIVHIDRVQDHEIFIFGIQADEVRRVIPERMVDRLSGRDAVLHPLRRPFVVHAPRGLLLDILAERFHAPGPRNEARERPRNERASHRGPDTLDGVCRIPPISHIRRRAHDDQRIRGIPEPVAHETQGEAYVRAAEEDERGDARAHPGYERAPRHVREDKKGHKIIEERLLCEDGIELPSEMDGALRKGIERDEYPVEIDREEVERKVRMDAYACRNPQHGKADVA